MGNSDIYNAISITETKAQYDNQAKKLLARKSILARILIHTVSDFEGMKPKEVEKLIVGTPQISLVPVEPGMTNHSAGEGADKITGFNTEDTEVNEGMIRFDIIFYVRTPDGLSQIIINVEAQKDEPSDYHILNRGIYYVSRMISSQKERDFKSTNYNDIKKVYSIWICMNTKECSLNHIHFTDEAILGNQHWKGNLDLVHLVMIGLPKKVPKWNKKYELHRLLTVLLSLELTAEERREIIQNEYQIEMNNTFEKELSIMCNLSEGVYERGIECGMERGMNLGMERGMNLGMERGMNLGMEQGNTIGQKRILTLVKYLMTDNRMEDVERMMEDEEYKNQLLKEYQLL